ncbi:hypothetical protein KC19_6G225700 [Ceratodon purpureus]|uniref:RING-type domain-containing protein n=1 Tax=Ceratodon purpureus TaxID=3225 RepID=A0A8T0HKJ4_CERPU|nr:hypothetical protein KC19_6G225700 [Ceratodon purpureus]
MVSEHLLDERQGRRVLDGALSKLLEVFPHVCQDAAAADLSSQLGKTSPRTALEDVMNRYLEHGVPDAEIVPREEPTPDLPRAIEHPTNRRGEGDDHGVGTSTGSRVEGQVDIAPEDIAPEVLPAGIECGCCYSDSRFEEMVQCAEGHLFCFTCLRRRVDESAFGGAQACASLPCMDTGGCEDFFPWSEVKRALPPDVLVKYEQRQAEDAVLQAKIPGLVYCPFCNTPWQVDPDLVDLECANEGCRKASCVFCREPSHPLLRCEDVEKGSETASRRAIEERMTKALVRVCTACKAEVLKTDGCNKVRCRCGQTMCYVCRQPIDGGYGHFCMHDPSPFSPNRGKECTKCNRCCLWHQEEEDDVAGAAREAAMKEVAQDDPTILKRTIGPSLQGVPQFKRHRFPAP